MPSDRSPFAARELDEYRAAFPRPGAPAWGFVEGPPRPLAATLLLRLCLWAGIVGRGWHSGRVGPVEAWRICAGVHPWREPVKRWVAGVGADAPGGGPDA